LGNITSERFHFQDTTEKILTFSGFEIFACDTEESKLKMVQIFLLDVKTVQTNSLAQFS